MNGYRCWVRAKDRRTFTSPDFKGDATAAREELSDAIGRGDLPEWVAGRVAADDIVDWDVRPDGYRTRAATVTWLLLFLIALSLDIWLVFVLPKGSWQDHAGALLAIIGFFAFATGFLKETELARRLDPLFLADLTSPKLFRFLSGNLKLMTASIDFALAFLYGREPWKTTTLGWNFVLFPVWVIVVIAEFLTVLLWLVADFAYLILVVPFAYLAYALVSLPLIRISQSDVEAAGLTNPWGLHPRAVVSSHMFELRVFTVGALSTFSAAAIKILPLY